MKVHPRTSHAGRTVLTWGLVLSLGVLIVSAARAQLPPAGENPAGLDQAAAVQDSLQVPSMVQGQVTEVLVKPGQRVKKGDVLARLDDQQARQLVKLAEIEVMIAKAELKSAEAAVGEAKAQYERILKLVRNTRAAAEEEVSIKKFVFEKHQHDMQVRQAFVEAAEVKLAGARARLDQYVLRAPEDGIVQAIHRRPGEAVRELQTVFRLQVGEAGME